MGLIAKVKAKHKQIGFWGLSETVARVLGAKLAIRSFKIKSFFFFLKLNRFSPDQFVLQPMGGLALNDYPVEAILEKVKSNQYVILSERFMDWGRSTKPGELHWNVDLINKITWPLDT